MFKHQALVLLLLLLTYSPLIFANDGDWEFITQWDDDSNFVENPIFQKGLTWSNWLRLVFFTSKINVYEPIAWLFKYVVFVLNGFQLSSHAVRLASFALHVLNSAVLLPACCIRFLKMLRHLQEKEEANNSTAANQAIDSRKLMIFRIELETIPCVYLACSIFAVHPVHVELVGWPSAQSYLLGGTFSLLSTFLFMEFYSVVVNLLPRMSEHRRYACLCGSVIMYAFAALSKGAFILLPLAFAAISLTLRSNEEACRKRSNSLRNGRTFNIKLTPYVARIALLYSTVAVLMFAW